MGIGIVSRLDIDNIWCEFAPEGVSVFLYLENAFSGSIDDNEHDHLS